MKRLINLIFVVFMNLIFLGVGNVLADSKCPLDLWWDMNLPGSDFRNFTIRKADAPAKERNAIEARECKRACGRDQRCKAWTYYIKDKRCYLKENVPRPVNKDWFVSGVKGPPPVQNEATTVGQIGVDRPGNDYRSFNIQRADARLCKQACDNEQQCRAWAMTKPGRDNPQARCWLKNQVPQPRPNGNVISGIKQQ